MYPEINKFVRLLHSKVSNISMQGMVVSVPLHLIISERREPIVYPKINKFVRLLHSKVSNISLHNRKCGIAH
jgi:hypothetical protein